MATISPTGVRPPQTDGTSSAKQPTAVFRFGAISAAVFTNQVKLQSGKTATVANVTLRRSYRSGETWEHTHSLRAQDLLPAALALTRCFESLADAANGNDEERE